MSTPNEGAKAPEAPAAPQTADEIKNLKAEMNRKLGNLEATNAELLKFVQGMKQPAQPKEPAKKVSVWDDEAAFEARIKAETAAEIEAKLSRQQQVQARTQNALAELASEYPEVNDINSALAKKAVELHSGLADDEKGTPVAMKYAVKAAAEELGIKPKSKRSDDGDDSFSLSGTPSGSRPGKKSRDSLDPKTEAFAEIMGIKLDDPKVRERLKNRTRDWTKWG